MDLREIERNYLSFIKAYKSVETFKCYEGHINIIISYLENHNINDSLKLKKINIIDFIEFQKTNYVSNCTINKRLNCLKRSFDYNYINYDKYIFTRLKENFITFDYLNQNKLIEICLFVKSSKLSLKNKLIFFLLVETGIRRREIPNIKLNDLIFEKNVIYLRFTKENRKRYIVYSSNVKSILSEYLGSINGEYLFPKTTVRSISDIFNRLKKKLNIKKLSCYVLRHSFATIFLNNNGNIEVLRKLMGHKSLNTTMRYLHTSLDDLVLNYSKVFPIL